MADSDEVDAHIQSMKELIDEMDDGAGDGGDDEGAFTVGSEPSGAFEPGDGDDDDAYTATSSAGDTGAHFGRGYEYGDGSSDVDEDDDEVVQELSLFVSKNLGDDGLLYLLQFPLRPSWRPYEAAATPSEVRIKPKQQKIEIAYAKETEDEEHFNADHPTVSLSDKFVLTSQRIPCTTNYAIAVVRGNEMHLTPLLERPLDIDQDTEVESTEAESNEPVMVEVNGQMVVVAGREDSMDTGANSGTSGGGGSGKLGAGGIVQLRPCFDHLDQEAKEAEELKRKAKLEQYLHKKKEEESGGSAQTGDGSLSVQFKKRESAYVKQAKKQSHASMVQRASEEPWIECKYYSSQTSEAAEVFDKLFCLSEGVIDLNVRSSDDYLKLLHPAPKKKDKDLPVTMPEKDPFHSWSLASRTQRSVEQQVDSMLRSAFVLPFSKIKQLIQPPVPDQQLISVLSTVAELVQGCWTVKSTKIYTAAWQCATRDALLRAFAASRYVNRGEFVKRNNCTFSPSDTKQLLETLAVYRPERREWEFKYPTDVEFLARFPNLQSYGSKSRLAHPAPSLGTGTSKAVLPPPTQPLTREDKVTRDFLQSMFLKYGVCNMVALKKAFEQHTQQPGYAIPASSLDELLRAHLEPMATKFHSAYILTQAPNSEMTDHRNALIGLLRTKTSVKKADIVTCFENARLPWKKAWYPLLIKEFATSKLNNWNVKSGDCAEEQQ